MRISIEEIDNDIEEEIIIRCHNINSNTVKMLQELKTSNKGIIGYKEKTIHRLSFDEIYYFEVVENKSFIYCKDDVYDSRLKLYEFEELSRGTNLFRAAKSMIINADKIDYITPSISGRFEATLLNGEKAVVSRQYVSELKKRMGI
ncbi:MULTISPECIES: LytTR family DNA-binding domain-containing protein [unclassified Ruminococcus]|uniref:LytTR family DNA-binding domain-containing protein n=1 Tax=unclassified Ruminococcus TaxID=2608920 RepID=UPI00210D05BA|nr:MULTISPECIES: LytTR family DNA-binding domain-containing protein [unclassified Ruminococcus]MCQ4022075.1 LytTR family transcriptional regulator [Ruminococcus sp. zg-924]MCQ4114395.1 LytTR family transcriptional regulator [Ruminococcus sp. zg-921]